MDGLSAAASGFAVVSIAIQLVESIRTVSDFIGSIQEAPEDIRSILSELQNLSSTLNDIPLHHSIYSTNSSAKPVLENLQRKLTSFMTLANKYKPGLDSKSRRIRKWNAIKMAFQNEKFKKLRESLNETKSTLSLALHVSQIVNSQRCCQQQDLSITARKEPNLQRNQSSNVIVTSSTETSSLRDDHIDDLKKEVQRIASAISNSALKTIFVRGMYQVLQDSIPSTQGKQDELVLKEETKHEPDTEIQDVTSSRKKSSQGSELDKKPTQKLFHERSKTTTLQIKTMLGTIFLRSVVYEDCGIHYRKNTYAPHQIESRFESFFVLHPADWLIWLGVSGLDVMISRSTQGWKHALRTFRAVPEDALIFEFCGYGNIEGVKTLLARGDASVWDQDPGGLTPLHVAMLHAQYQVCKFLIDQGSEKNAMTHPLKTLPVTLHGLNVDRYRPTDLNVIRTFFECFDFGVHPGENDESMNQSWLFFVYSVIRESDEMYNVVASDEHEKIHPKSGSICQLLLDVFGSDIRENLTDFSIIEVWYFARSLLFLKWFMASTNSEALTIHRDTGRSPIPSIMLTTYDFASLRQPYNPDNPDLAKDKVKFLAKKGAYLHYVEYLSGSPTAIAMKFRTRFYLWCEIIHELGIDFQLFVEEEIEKGSLQQEGWNHKTLMNLFQTFQPEKSQKDDKRWDVRDYCPSCGSQKPTSWELFLEDIKSGDSFDISEDHEVSEGHEVKEVRDDEEVSDDEEISDDEEVDDDGRIYRRKLCDLCRETQELAIPGSFEPALH